MVVEKLVFMGRRDKEAPGADKAQVELRSDGLWIYVEEVNGVVQIWSGGPCAHCKRSGTRWIRCRLHAGVMMIARQLDLI
jgi:hypothetical protein